MQLNYTYVPENPKFTIKYLENHIQYKHRTSTTWITSRETPHNTTETSSSTWRSKETTRSIKAPTTKSYKKDSKEK